MDITVFLAQIWGPVLLAVGLGVLVSRRHYVKIYRNLGQESLAILVFAIAAIAIGITQIAAHNIWGNLSEVLISLFGWILLVKGAVFAIHPKSANKVGSWWTDNSSLFTVAATLVLVIGAYLSWFGFLM